MPGVTCEWLGASWVKIGHQAGHNRPVTAPQGFRPVTEAEVVLAFLRGEVDSHRFGGTVEQALRDAGGLHLIREPRLDSAEENQARARALGTARGWRDQGLFEGFPHAVDWYHGELPNELLKRVRFIDYSYWNELSGGSRQPIDVLPTVQSGNLPDWLTDLGTEWCFELADRLTTSNEVGDLIVMTDPDLDQLVLLEGHARLTALFVGRRQDRVAVRTYLGMSPAIDQWDCF
jgi:hypothetical protein